MHIRWWKGVVVSLVPILLVACGGGNGGDGQGDAEGGNRSPSGPDDNAQIAAACEELAWSSGLAQPLDGVAIRNLQGPILTSATATPRGLYAELLDEDEKAAAVLPVAAASDDDGDTALGLTAPAHPQTPFEGGEVQVRLVVDGHRCPAQSLSVGALPEAVDPDATLDGTVNAFKALIAASAEPFGYITYEQVAAARDDVAANARENDLRVAAPMLPLIVAVDVVEIFEGLNTTEDVSDEARKVLAALLESVGDQGFSAEAAELADALTATPSATTPSSASNARLERQEALMTMSVDGPSGACAAAISDPININSALALDDAMNKQRGAEKALSPTESLQGFTMGAAEGVLPVAGVVSPGAAAAAGAFVYLVKLIELVSINTLPSTFVELEPTLHPGADINEGYERAGNDARWSELMATAESKGMDLAGPSIEGLQTLLGGLGWASSAKTGIVDRALDFGQDQLKDVPKSKAWAALEAVSEASGCFAIAPRTYGPIDITSDVYATAEVNPGTAISLALGSGGLNDTDIQLKHTGEAVLTLETHEDRFGGRSESWAENIRVREIRLEPNPSFMFAEALGATETFRIFPRNAEQPGDLNLQAATIAGGGSVTFGPDLDIQDFILDYETPDRVEDYPVVIELSGQGALPAGSPGGSTERTAGIEISRRARVELVPDGACIEPGKTVNLAAQVFGESSPNFDWAVTSGGGSLSGAVAGNDATVETNIYQAPASGNVADVEVTHTSANGETDSDSSSIQVGNCDSGLAVYGRYSARAASGNSQSFSEETGPRIPLSPEKPAQFWPMRQENPASSLSDSRASIMSSALFESDGAGTATYALNMTNGNITCVPEDPEDVNDDGVKCGGAEAGADMDLFYWLEISAPATYQFEFSVQCSQTGKGWAQLFLIPTLFRYIEGEGDALPANGAPTLEIEPEPGNFINVDIDSDLPNSAGISIGDGAGANVCKDVLEPVTVTKTLDFQGPATTGTTDIIALEFLIEGDVGIDRYDVESTKRDQAFGDIILSGQPPLGSNVGTAAIDIEVTMQRK